MRNPSPRLPRIAPDVRLVRETPRVPMLTAQIRSAPDAARLLAPRLGVEEVEVFLVLVLNAQRRVTATVEVTRGIVDASLVSPREVFRTAIALNAVSIIIAHNHPSGVTAPSEDDKTITRQLVDAGKLLGIPVLDHLILGGVRDDGTPSFYSFIEAGLL